MQNTLITLALIVGQLTSGLMWAAPSRDDFDQGIMAAAQVALERDIDRLGLDQSLYYAVMDIQQAGPTAWFVSLVGVTESEWRFDDHAVWFGTAFVYWSQTYGQYVGSMTDSPSAPRSLMGDMQPATSMDVQMDQSEPTAGYIFPWAEGSTMFFGPLGVHNVGYGQDPNKVKAVDFVSGSDFGGSAAPDTVVAAATGTIIATCRDSTSMAIVVDSYGSRFVYAHLQIDGSLTKGREITQGEPFGVLVWGDFTGACGYADQEPDHYHLHFGMPSDTDQWRLEDCTITFSANSWDCDGTTVEPGDWFPIAEGNPWTGGGGKNTFSNFWDHMLSGWVNMILTVFSGMPDHKSANIASNVIMNANFILKVTYVLLLTNFRMGLPMALFGLVLILETGRLIYTAYMLIKKAIPVIG